jgi:hypothetical protein
MVASFLFSCSKSGSNVSIKENGIETGNVNQNSVNLIQGLVGSEQKVAYLLLNNDEKSAVWKTKFESIIANESLNTAQKDFIKRMILLLKKNLLGSSNTSVNKITLTNLAKESITLFEYNEAYKLMTTLEVKIKQGPQPNLSDDPGGDIIRCNCSKDSDWCLTGDCKETNPSCEGGNNCGTFWNYKCDGKCNK